MHQRGERLDPKRLDGLWKLIYEEKEKTEGIDCISMKIVSEVEGGNSSQVQIFYGYQIPSPKQEDAKTKEKKYQIVYEDGYLTFNHP